MPDPTSKPSRTRSRIAAIRAEHRKLHGLDTKFRNVMLKVDSDPTLAVKEVRTILKSLLLSFIKAEGLVLPEKRDLFSLWSVARPAFGSRDRVDPEGCIVDRLSHLLFLVESTLFSEIKDLPHHGLFVEGVGVPQGFQTAEARLIGLLGHVAAVFVISIGAENADDRLTEVRRRP